MKGYQKSHMYLNIKRDAIFVADSHFNEKREELKIFLEKLQRNEITTSQLFLMGDMFDFLSVEIDYFIIKNRKIINLINSLSNQIEIIYLEGNHDYNLKDLFPNIKVINRKNQPLNAKYESKNVKISHGDIFTPWHYNLYCCIIRNHYFLKLLNFLDFNHSISRRVNNSLFKKMICKKMDNFIAFAKNRVELYNSDIIVEGHFHQGEIFCYNDRVYVNVPSLCCENKYFRLTDSFVGEKL